MILADTSAWIEYDRKTGSVVHLRMRELIETGGPLAVTEPVAMELLVGVPDGRRDRDLRTLLLRFDQLPFDAVADFDSAVRIFRRCREAGVTPRGMIDCMIAAVALRTGSSLLARDVDLERVAGVVGVEWEVL